MRFSLTQIITWNNLNSKTISSSLCLRETLTHRKTSKIFYLNVLNMTYEHNSVKTVIFCWPLFYFILFFKFFIFVLCRQTSRYNARVWLGYLLEEGGRQLHHHTSVLQGKRVQNCGHGQNIPPWWDMKRSIN